MGQHKSIYAISSTAMFESVSYYIFAGVLVMYMIDVLHFSDPFSTYIFGVAYGSTYILQLIGGYVCDNIWATERQSYLELRLSLLHN